MGNALGIVSGKAVCIVGGVVLVFAKPVCDYTVNIVMKQIGGRLLTIESDVKRVVELAEDAKNSADATCMRVTESNKAIVAIASSLEHIDTELKKMSELIMKLEHKPLMIKAVKGIDEANSKIGDMLGVIDSTAKKYSTYLHNEHEDMYKLILANAK